MLETNHNNKHRKSMKESLQFAIICIVPCTLSIITLVIDEYVTFTNKSIQNTMRWNSWQNEIDGITHTVIAKQILMMFIN